MNLNAVATLYPDSFGQFQIAKRMAVSIAATGDAVIIGVPYARIRVRRVAVVVPPAAAGGINVSGGFLGIFDAAAAGGNGLVANAQISSCTAADKYQELTMAAIANTQVVTSGSLYVNVGTAVTAGLIDVYIYGDIVGDRA